MLANLAQMVEQHPRNVQVVGSIPIVGSYRTISKTLMALY